MSGDSPSNPQPAVSLAGLFAILLGLYLTFRGYHSFDGDQAYRLPLLLHRQDPQALRRRSVRQGYRRLQPAPGLAARARPGHPARLASRAGCS